MTIAYWCVLVTILFPYIFAFIAKMDPHYNNHTPREYLQTLTGWRKRAHNVQLNCFETGPAFGITVIIAHLLQAPQVSLDKLAIAFVIARIIYAICYLTDKASLRTLFWTIGMGCMLGIFYLAVAHS
jgi:uncharacterized MAPEG superfamily protein